MCSERDTTPSESRARRTCSRPTDTWRGTPSKPASAREPRIGDGAASRQRSAMQKPSTSSMRRSSSAASTVRASSPQRVCGRSSQSRDRAVQGPGPGFKQGTACERARKAVHSEKMARSTTAKGASASNPSKTEAAAREAARILGLPTADYEAPDVLLVDEPEQLRALGDDLRARI